VELISALQTSEDTLERARAFAIACGKGIILSSPSLELRLLTEQCTCNLEVTVSKDVPGFVSNALLMPFINEVCRHQHAFEMILTMITSGYHVLREGDDGPKSVLGVTI
jgi:3-hydroxyacyl-CoA dehydrogenase